MNRREFLETAAGAAVVAACPARAEQEASPAPVAAPLPTANPRWRGFNLPPFFGTWNSGQPVEEDFQMISDLGFNFVRLPAWYTLWSDAGNWRSVREEVLEQVDRAIEYGGKYGLHVNLNLHRAPGYCVAKEPPEPFDLFKDTEALEAFCFEWDLFAKRYKGVSNDKLSFNLLNEPMAPKADYSRVVRAAVKTIRETSLGRTIVVDGLFIARAPLPELADTGVIQSVHSYDPMPISHYKASWVEESKNYPEPNWPITKDGKVFFDRGNLERFYAPWIALADSGVGVHCGECGGFNQTPHPVFLKWFEDVLGVLSEHKIGYALWEFRGAFGVLDSQRSDVAYEDWHGHKLDRKLLELLQAH